jgi:ferritin-like metal-binding protein YciE
MKLRNLSDLFLYELCTLSDAKKQVIAVLLRMSRLASTCELREQLKTDADNAKGHMEVIRTIMCSYQGISPARTCAAMNGLIASSDLLFNTCIATNAGALDAALICAWLDIVHHELARLERLRLYAKLLSDCQTVAILNAMLDEVTEAKHRLAELIGRYINLDSVSDPEPIPVPGDTPASPQNSHTKTIDTLIAG